MDDVQGVQLLSTSGSSLYIPLLSIIPWSFYPDIQFSLIDMCAW